MMSGVIRQEAAVFLLSVLHGAALTLAYDILRSLRRAFRHGLAAVSAEDFLYWLAAGFSTFCLAFSHTDGVIRGYVAAGIAIGAVLYHMTLSGPLVRGLSAVLRGVRNFVRLIVKILAKPLEIFCRFFKKIIEFVGKKGYNVIKFRIRGSFYGRKKKTAEQQQPKGDGCDRGGRYGIAHRSARAEPEAGRTKSKI